MAIENGVQNAELGYILDPAFQIENINGKPAVGGHIEIFEAGTDNKYISYQNFDGAQNPFKIPLGADGRAVILGDPSLSYDVYAYDSYNNLMFSRLNVQCNVPGTINLSGADTRIKNTDGTLDISLQTLGNNVRQYTINTHNKVLDVQSPLYFVENSETATVIGFSGDDFASKEYVDSAISSKLDTTAFSNVSGDFLTDKFEYDDDNNITAYNHSAFAGGGGSGPNYEAGDHIAITDNVISVTGLPDSADLENAITSAVTNVENKFEYNENNYITAYNNSAFAGKEYSAGDGISIVNNVISVTSQGGGIEQVSHDDTLSGNGNSIPLGIANIENFVKQNDLTAYQEKGNYYSASNPSGFITNDAITGLQPSGDYATKTELESATSGKMDVTGMTAYQPTGDYATHDDLTAYQPVGDYYSASNPSGFITNDAITGLQPAGDYATRDDLTAYQPIGDYADASALDSKVDTSSFTAFSSTTNEKIEYISGALSGSYELSAGSGINITDYPNEQKTVISVTAQGGNPEVENLVIANSATWDSVTSKADATALNDYATTAQLANKLDTTAFSTVSGNFITAHQDISDLMPKSESANFYPMTGNPSGFLTAHQDLSDYAKTEDLTAYQEKGDYYSASNPSGFLTKTSADTLYQTKGDYADATALDSKVDTSSFSSFSSTTNERIEYLSATLSGSYELSAGNGIDITDYPAQQKTVISVTAQGGDTEVDQVVREYSAAGTWLTAHQDLSDYQTTAGMTAYQPVGDYYSASNPSGFLTAVPAGTMNESNFGYDADDNITAYNGSAFKAGGGGDLPQSANDAINYVTANSGDIDSTIDNVSSNSAAWGGEKLPIIAGNGIALSYNSTALTISAVPASFYSAGIANIVLTASMPGSPDANTLYLIPE